MDFNLLIPLIGHPINNNNVYKTLSALGFNLSSVLSPSYIDHSYQALAYHNNGKISIRFTKYSRYKNNYGEPLDIISKNSDELILEVIRFHAPDNSKFDESKTALPYNLKFGQNKEVVFSELKNCSNIIRLHYASRPNAISFIQNGYNITIWFSEKFELELFIVTLISLDRKAKISLQKSIPSQSPNIIKESSQIIQAYKKELPTEKWKARMEDGNDLFTLENIKETENVLINFINLISSYVVNQDAIKIYDSVEILTKEINQIASKYNSLIETLEREDLCCFIDKIIISTGLEIDDIDLTEDWREW